MNNSKNRTTLWILLAVALVGCLCLLLVAAGVLGYSFFQPASASTPAPIISPSGELAPHVVEQMITLQQQVEKLRGLPTNGDFTRELLTPAQLKQRVIDDLLADYTPQEAQNDARALSTFGLLQEDYDLMGLYTDLYSEQVAGFFDTETDEMVIVRGQGFEGPERITYVHEYVHALQDRTYDLQEGLEYTQEVCEVESERCAAVQALIEGDATFVELQWVQEQATRTDIQELQQFYRSLETPVYDSAPLFLKQDFLFPYMQGLEFVQYLFERGGWVEVNQAFQNPPVSTEQILHPERYPSDKPVEVTLPDIDEVLGEGWQQVDQGVMGEWYTFLILAHGLDPQARLEESYAQSAAQGWGGDAYAVYYQPDNGALVMILYALWESPQEAQEFSSAFQDYANVRFGASNQHPEVALWQKDGNVTLFSIENERTIWILAPDRLIAESVYTQVER